MPSGVSHGSGTAPATGTAASANTTSPKSGIRIMACSITQVNRRTHYRVRRTKRHPPLELAKSVNQSLGPCTNGRDQATKHSVLINDCSEGVSDNDARARVHRIDFCPNRRRECQLDLSFRFRVDVTGPNVAVRTDFVAVNLA